MSAGLQARGPRPAEAPDTRPGRTCPTSYRYPPRVFDRAPDIVAETLYVVGGLYGHVEALAALERLAAREPGPVRIVFNGDFHWFDIDRAEFEHVDAAVRAHTAIRGNVETELASDGSAAGCGCAYPADVSDADVSRSNAILERLRATARATPARRDALGALPMHLVARVGAARVGIVHGDAGSLAGWGFAIDRLDDPAHRRWLESAFRDAQVDIFASSHTCMPAMRVLPLGAGTVAIANNGAAGLPNFAATRHGLLTRIGTRAFAGEERLYGTEVRGVALDALRLDYDHERWVARFLASWPPASPAHASYFHRITEGPRFTPQQSAPRSARVA
jgi:hypothetical protein